MSVVLRKSTDPIFDDSREFSEARDKATDTLSFLAGYNLGYRRGYGKAWTEGRTTKNKSETFHGRLECQLCNTVVEFYETDLTNMVVNMRDLADKMLTHIEHHHILPQNL